MKKLIEYEFNYISLSSSRRDEDNVSDFDKYESNLIKQDESLFLQSNMNCKETMNRLIAQYGPFDSWIVDFYKDRLKNDKGVIINSFQRQLIFNMFYKDFFVLIIASINFWNIYLLKICQHLFALVVKNIIVLN